MPTYSANEIRTFFIVDFPLKNFVNIVIGHFPFLLYRTFSFIGHFHGTPLDGGLGFKNRL